jgi:hypothetical protein
MSNRILLSTEHTLVIDTNAYAGNFVKKLCAYCTGFVCENDEGRDLSDLYYLEMGIEDDDSPRGRLADEKNPFYGFVGDRKDEDDNWSPCSMWLNKRYGCNAEGEFAPLNERNYDEFNFPAPFSVGIFFDQEPTPEHVKIIGERAKAFFEKVWPKLSPDSQPVKLEALRLITHTKYAEEKEL